MLEVTKGWKGARLRAYRGSVVKLPRFATETGFRDEGQGVNPYVSPEAAKLPATPNT